MIKNAVMGNLTTTVAGMLQDQSLANKIAGRFGSDDVGGVYIGGVVFKDPADPQSLVFQSYRANFDFTDYNNIAGVAIANNATTQPIEYNNDTPEDVIIPIKRKTQFSVVPFNQLFQMGYWVKQGEATGAVANGQVLYKKIPTAGDTSLDKSIYYAFNKNTTQSLVAFTEVGVMVAQTKCTSNVSPNLYPNCVLVIGTTYNVIVQHYAGATGLENNKVLSEDEMNKLIETALQDKLESYQSQMNEEMSKRVEERFQQIVAMSKSNQPAHTHEVMPTAHTHESEAKVEPIEIKPVETKPEAKVETKPEVKPTTNKNGGNK